MNNQNRGTPLLKPQVPRQLASYVQMRDGAVALRLGFTEMRRIFESIDKAPWIKAIQSTDSIAPLILRGIQGKYNPRIMDLRIALHNTMTTYVNIPNVPDWIPRNLKPYVELVFKKPRAGRTNPILVGILTMFRYVEHENLKTSPHGGPRPMVTPAWYLIDTISAWKSGDDDPGGAGSLLMLRAIKNATQAKAPGIAMLAVTEGGKKLALKFGFTPHAHAEGVFYTLRLNERAVTKMKTAVLLDESGVCWRPKVSGNGTVYRCG